MFNEINNLLKKSRNIDINSLPKISKTYTLFKKYPLKNYDFFW